MPDNSPLLSLCVIVKNEQANLPRCLASVEGVVDEIVVTDTGSTDDTVRIATDAGAVVHHFPWCDDFAAAYNACFEQARGEWIFMLDADEELADWCREDVAQLVRDESAMAYFVLRQDYYGDEVRPDAYSEMLQLRLFRNRPESRYVGRIHQQFPESLDVAGAREGRSVRGSEVRIKHYGYMGDLTTRKLDRSIRLMEMELRERPGQFYYLVELARCKLMDGDRSGLDELAQGASMIESGEVPLTERSPMPALLFEQILALGTLPDTFPMSWERAATLATRHYPDTPPIDWHIARGRFAQGDHEESARLLERILHLGKTGAYNKMSSFNPRILYADGLLNLGVCYAHLGRIDDAKECFHKLLDDPRHAPSARTNLDALSTLPT